MSRTMKEVSEELRLSHTKVLKLAAPYQEQLDIYGIGDIKVGSKVTNRQSPLLENGAVGVVKQIDNLGRCTIQFDAEDMSAMGKNSHYYKPGGTYENKYHPAKVAEMFDF